MLVRLFCRESSTYITAHRASLTMEIKVYGSGKTDKLTFTSEKMFDMILEEYQSAGFKPLADGV